MIDLCLFDFDSTLIMTDDLWEIRYMGKDKANNHGPDPEYERELRRRVGDVERRLLFTQRDLFSIRERFPEMKFGLFTRAPAAYIWVVDNMAYPEFFWDTVICYESITNGLFKPHGYGISAAMEDVGLHDPSRVVMVGDEAADIRAAYNAGCYAVLDKRSWPNRPDPGRHVRALELVPDCVIGSAAELAEFLTNPPLCAPALEYHASDEWIDDERLYERRGRYETISYSFPQEDDRPIESYDIVCAGRHFSGYRSLDARRKWHTVTGEIHRHKDSTEFPLGWCSTVHGFVLRCFPGLAGEWRDPVTISAIPSRPGREPRLQHFVNQFHAWWNGMCWRRDALVPDNDLLVYDQGARSHSGERLSREERFSNVRDHLHVRDRQRVAGKDIILLDDVVTSGASLMHAKAKLEAAGAKSVHLLALAKNISDVLK